MSPEARVGALGAGKVGRRAGLGPGGQVHGLGSSRRNPGHPMPQPPMYAHPKNMLLGYPWICKTRGAWRKLPELVVGALLAVYRPTSLLLGTPALYWLHSRSQDQGPPAGIPASYSPTWCWEHWGLALETSFLSCICLKPLIRSQNSLCLSL